MKSLLLKKSSTILIALALHIFAANAQIVYTDVVPDSTSSGSYNLDLNNDGISDSELYPSSKVITIHCSCGYPRNVYEYEILVEAVGSNAIGLSHSHSSKSKLNRNEVIDSNVLSWTSFRTLSKQNYERTGICYYTACLPKSLSMTGDWSSDATDKYLALRIKSGTSYYYGWIRLTVSGVWSYTVKDYAYNTTINQPILAVETACKTPKVTLAASGSLSFCSGDSVILTASGTGYLYQWQRDGQDLPKKTSNEYAAKKSGKYKCIVTNSCGSMISAGENVSVTCLHANLPVQNQNLITKKTILQVSPNPFSNSTTISFALSESQKISIQIFDVAGRLIKTLADAEMQAGHTSFYGMEKMQMEVQQMQEFIY